MKKFLSILCVFAMIISMIPTMAFAAVTTLQDSDVTIAKTSITYTGSEADPGITVKSGEDTLVLDTDYTVTYKKESATVSPVAAGSYTAVIEGIGEYSGSIEKEFTITAKTATGLTVAIPNQEVGETPDYSGLEIKDGSNTLVDGTDYDISFTENEGKVKLGTNNATITYKGNYTGTRNITFAGKYDIEKYYTAESVQTTLKECTYAHGTKQTPSMKLVKKSDDAPTIATTDYTVEYSDNENYTGSNISATVKGKNNFMGTIADVDTNYIISKKSIADSKIKITVETSSAKDVAPAVTIVDGSYTLVKGADKDYTVDVTEDNKIQITGQNNYNNSVEKTFTVGTPITEVALSSVSFTYNGNSQMPSLTVKTATGAIVPTNGYRVEWPSDTKNVGEKKFKVIGIGSYAGQYEGTYVINKKSATNVEVTIPSDSYKYTGYAITPAVTVKDGVTPLVLNKDYTVRYTGSVAPGTAYVTVEFQNNYIGTKSIPYYIGRESISGLTIKLDKTSYDYTGSAIRPYVTLMDGAKVVSSANYVVSYKDNTNVGTGTVIVTGLNEYYGSLEAKFSITGKDVSKCNITLSPNTFAADGTAKKPIPTVKDDTTTLKENVDYTVTYANNITAGTGSVTITGKGAYGGTQTVYFTITGLDQKISVEKTSYTKYPTSASFKLEPIANGDGTGFTYTSGDVSVATVAADGTVTITGIGKTTITVATKGDKKYTPVTKAITITVKPEKVAIKSLSSTKQGKMTVKYQKQPGGITGTQIRYSKKSDFSTYATYTNKSTNTSDVMKTGTKTLTVKSGKTYYVKVRNYKTLDNGKKLYGSWSTVKKVVVK